MARSSFLLSTVVAALIAAGCVGAPTRSPNPLGHASTHKDLATQEQFPLRSSPVKEEVDRVFEEEHPGVVNWIFVWGKDRWFDLMDIISWDVHFGRGFGANLALTEYAQIGLNWWEGTALGQRGRAWGMWHEESVDRGLGPFYWLEYERSPTWGTQSLFDHEYKYMGWDLLEESPNKAGHNDWSEVGGSVNLFAVGARAFASPIEAVDFIAGLIPIQLVTNIIGYHQPVFDIQGDDTWSELRDDLARDMGLGE